MVLTAAKKIRKRRPLTAATALAQRTEHTQGGAHHKSMSGSISGLESGLESGPKTPENQSGVHHERGHVINEAADFSIEIAVPDREGRSVTSNDFA